MRNIFYVLIDSKRPYWNIPTDAASVWELPEPILNQADGTFAILSNPGLIISFKSENNNAILSITSPGSYIESGARIG